jgi:hypothetical protein
MNTITIKILKPKVFKLLKTLEELKLISIHKDSRKEFTKGLNYLEAIENSRGMLKGGRSLTKELMKEKKRELKAEDRKYKRLYRI